MGEGIDRLMSAIEEAYAVWNRRVNSPPSGAGFVWPVGGGGGGTVTNDGPGPTADQTSPDAIWPVKTREHVDLWLHGYALLQEDTTFVPFFKRGYGTNMIVLKNRANVVTQRDPQIGTLPGQAGVRPQQRNLRVERPDHARRQRAAGPAGEAGRDSGCGRPATSTDTSCASSSVRYRA